MDVPRRLETRYRVRFDEADADGRLRPSGFLRYAQDVAWLHSEAVGFGREWYAEREMHWLVRNVSLRIMGPVTYGDVLSTSTEVIGWRHVWARRHSELRRVGAAEVAAEGELMATVDTDWVLLTNEGRPARVPEDFARLFASVGTFARRRVALPDPDGPLTTLSTRVRPHDIDPMAHMNNAAYLDFVQDGLERMPTGTTDGLDCYQVGYLRPALPGAAVEIACWPTAEGSVACRISDGDGNELTKVLVSRSDDTEAG